MANDINVGVKCSTSQKMVIGFMANGNMYEVVACKKIGEDFHSIMIVLIDIRISSKEYQAFIAILISKVSHTIVQVNDTVKEVIFPS